MTPAVGDKFKITRRYLTWFRERYSELFASDGVIGLEVTINNWSDDETICFALSEPFGDVAGFCIAHDLVFSLLDTVSGDE